MDMRVGFLSLKRLSIVGMACVLAGSVNYAKATATVSVDPSQNWIGYMNVSELPANGGGYDFGSNWATGDLDASFTGPVATLSPNTSIDRDVPTDSYWWQGGTGPGNHIMAASFYVENDPGAGSLSGQTVTFTGNVLSNTLVSPYTSVAFIDDFTPSYGLVNSITTPLVAGVYSISLPIAAGDILQYGFTTTGPNARIAAEPSLGNVQVTAVPEPASVGLLAIGGLAALRRKR
jgi:hypothetical protein